MQAKSRHAVICRYLADQKHESGLALEFGTAERRRCRDVLSLVGFEIHSQIAPPFNPERISEMARAARQRF